MEAKGCSRPKAHSTGRQLWRIEGRGKKARSEHQDQSAKDPDSKHDPECGGQDGSLILVGCNEKVEVACVGQHDHEFDEDHSQSIHAVFGSAQNPRRKKGDYEGRDLLGAEGEK